MKIAFNPSTVAALIAPPNNKDITFDLRGRNIFARGVKFCGTDTNTWRDIKINNVSIGSNTLDLRNGSNTTLTNTNGVVTINSTWRPVVDNLTSDSTTSSLSAKQGKVLKSLIDGKSNSGHTHDDRYLKLTGGTMASNALITFADSGSWGTDKGPQGARGGLYWIGQSDYAKLYAEETAVNNLDLVIQFGDDNSNGLSIRNASNVQTSYISAGGVITTGTFKGNLDWSYITNKPTTTTRWPSWAEVTGKPSSFTPSTHTHGLSNSVFFLNMPSISENAKWKEVFGYPVTYNLLLSVRINNPAPEWCVGNFGSGILYGGSDTKGFMSSAYNEPLIMWAGGNGSSGDSVPKWYIGIKGIHKSIYNLATIASEANAAYNLRHSHSNKSVLDGITSALVNNWNTAYTFVNTITGTDTDKVINKWDEIVNFLAGITEDNKLNTLLNSKLSVYELANNTNVGAIKNNGIYYSTSDASSGTLTNSPFNTGFALINMTSYDGGDDLRRSRLAFNAYGEIKVSDDRDLANTAETWYNVLTSKNSGISGSTIKLNGTSITVYSSSTADGRYVKKSGDTMLGALNFANGTWNLVGDDSYMGDCNVSGHFGIRAANTTYPGIAFFNKTNAHLGNLTAYNGNIKYGAYSLQFLDNGNASVGASTWMNPFSTYNASAIADGQAICVWGQSSYLSNLSSDAGNMSLWLKRGNAKVATLNMVLDGEYYANGNLRLAHISEIPTALKNPHALTISLNGTSQGPYDGSAAKNINITPGSIGAATSGHNHDGRYVYNYGGTQMDGASINKNALGMTTNSGITGDWWHILQAAWNGEYCWNSLIAFPTLNRNGMYYRSGLADNTKWGSWVKLLDVNNYSSTLDSRYYTESEVNNLLNTKLNRQNLSYGTWNPRDYNLAADYAYNGGDLSISESGGKMHVSVDGYFWLNEGLYRVLDTSDISSIRGGLTLYQHLSATDTTWWPLVWGGSDHKNTNNSTGSLYKSYDKLSWQTSSLTLYATNIQTNNIKKLSIGGGIYWNPYVESTTDGSDAASITLVKSGVAGGTTLVLSLMNDANDTILFQTNGSARLYHNSYPILTTLNTYVSNNKGYINGTEITLVNNSDKLDGYHASAFVKMKLFRFSQHNQGTWTKILTITINSTTDLLPVIAFSWIPSECNRDIWADFSINWRSNYPIFYAIWKGMNSRTLKVVNSSGAIWDVWVSGSKTGYDPFGEIQVTYTHNITSYNGGSLGYSDTDPGGTICITGGQVNYATYAAKLQTPRQINGTNFDGSANITTSYWGTTRTLTIGNSGKSVNGSANISWSLSEIGAADVNHTHGLLHSNLTVNLANTTTDSGWSMINSSYNGFLLKSIRTLESAPNWIENAHAAGICFGGSDTKGVISVAYRAPYIKFAGGNGSKPVWWIRLSGISGATYNLANFNADTLDGIHANGLLTALSNSNNGISITVGGTTKSVANISVNYANSSGYTNYLNSVSRMDYGWNGINYFNASLTAGCAAKVNDSPTSAWWHILRFNHNNNSGYYTDLAIPFNNNSLYWKTVRNGSLAYSSWVKVLDSLNYNEYAPTKTGGGASGTWSISITGNANTVDGQHFNWNNNKNDHTFLWAATDNGNAYLVHRASISVNYANSAGSASSATKVIVNLHTTNDTNYPLVWSNLANTNTVTENLLFKSWSDLYYNPKNKRLTVGGSVVASSFIKSGGTSLQLLRADGGIATFNWSGQSGLPSWLWGGNNLHSYYVYNPSNFRVAYASSAGNADTVDGYHASDGRTFTGNINWASNWNDTWSDGTHTHPWYGFDHRYPNTGAYSTTISDYFGMTIKTAKTLRLDFGTLLLNGTSIYSINVASASKLATARSIWGQSFDGTGNVSGALSNTGTITASAAASYDIGSNSLDYRYGYFQWIGAKSNTNLRLAANNSDNQIVLHTNGNVGIGTNAPAYKLDVNGLMRSGGFHHSSVNSDNYILLAGGGYKSFGGSYDNPIFLGYLNLYHGNDGTISSSFLCLGYSVPFTYTRGGNYCKISIPDTSYQVFYIYAAIASVNYSGGGMDTWAGYHRGTGAWWLHCYASGLNEVRVKGFRQANDNNDSWWGGNPLWSDNDGANKITVCIFGYVTFK